MEIPQNKQFIIETEALLDYYEKKISIRKFVDCETEILRQTLKENDFRKMGKIYLTEMEITCIRNRWRGLKNEEKKKGIQFLLNIYEEYSSKNGIANAISMYEFVTEGAVSELGNMGEHELAILIDNKSIKESLKCRRLIHIDYKLYDIFWNTQEILKKKGIKMNLEKKRMKKHPRNG